MSASIFSRRSCCSRRVRFLLDVDSMAFCDLSTNVFTSFSLRSNCSHSSHASCSSAFCTIVTHTQVGYNGVNAVKKGKNRCRVVYPLRKSSFHVVFSVVRLFEFLGQTSNVRRQGDDVQFLAHLGQVFALLFARLHGRLSCGAENKSKNFKPPMIRARVAIDRPTIGLLPKIRVLFV